MSLIIHNPPILYSLQNCPYAIRARFTLFRAQRKVLLRAVKLNNKPTEMLNSSPKGSVPVLVVRSVNDDDVVIQESLEIMLWALEINDPTNLLAYKDTVALHSMLNLINDFDTQFIPALEAYCCAKRYHETDILQCRTRCEEHLQQLEQRLSAHAFLFNNQETLLDIAIFPFIRKFARVERQWYRQSPYVKLRAWLDNYLQSPAFTKVMEKHELWLDNKQDIYFAG